ncbi:hypothetical protein FH972_022796 [Carpinus fangiana]|uniref:Uncharacterized protein n=1 Tax=Carpinus fangiana TaxID=176857 RepID=A0A5N6KTY5_9ROSI|nr:hypothetical protein FH972_022796 [Carpinus fangiana]
MDVTEHPEPKTFIPTWASRSSVESTVGLWRLAVVTVVWHNSTGQGPYEHVPKVPEGVKSFFISHGQLWRWFRQLVGADATLTRIPKYEQNPTFEDPENPEKIINNKRA